MKNEKLPKKEHEAGNCQCKYSIYRRLKPRSKKDCPSSRTGVESTFCATNYSEIGFTIRLRPAGGDPRVGDDLEIGAMLLFFMLLKSAILCDLYLITYIICAIETPCDANLFLPFVSIHFVNSRCYF